MSTSYTTETTTTVTANDGTQQPRGTTSTTYTFENGDQTQAPGATIVGDIIPGQEANARAALEAMGTLPFNDPNFDLEKLETIHFARFMLINNDTQVLFMVVFDGDLEEYIRDFHDIFVRNNVIPSFQYCVGFPENWKEDLPGLHQVLQGPHAEERRRVRGLSLSLRPRDEESRERLRRLLVHDRRDAITDRVTRYAGR